MQPFTTLTGVAAPLEIRNVDTDMIIPKQYLKTIKRTGLGTGLFAEMRYKEDGVTENPDFVLNQPAYRKAQIIVAEDNFGCGSSREHAPWVLLDFGIRCVISTSFADIFYNNSFQNGMLLIRLPEETVQQLIRKATEQPGWQLTIDLPSQTIKDEAGLSIPFELDPFRKHRLLHGLDDIGTTLQHEPDITAFESRRPRWASRVGAAA